MSLNSISQHVNMKGSTGLCVASIHCMQENDNGRMSEMTQSARTADQIRDEWALCLPTKNHLLQGIYLAMMWDIDAMDIPHYK
jgi:hypothetical protein